MGTVDQGRVTLDDVARGAGVSRATASKALNNRSDVAASTRTRVLAASEALGYRPALVPAPLPYPSVALVADNLATFYTLEILKGAVSAALREGVSLTVSYTPGPPPGTTPVPLEESWFDLIHANRYLGVIVVTTPLSDSQLAKARSLDLPLVAIDPANALPHGARSIGATNWNGGVEATQHLIDLGHRRIAFVRGPAESVPSGERLQGYLSALQMNDLPVLPELIRGDDFTYETGLEVGRELLALPPSQRPTAVFAGADAIALGLYEAAREAGLSIPGDISVVGFDDTDMAAWATPRLTTVHQPLHDMGAAGVRLVVDLARGSEPSMSGPVRLATTLVLRDSTGPAPS
ncbi:LacI family DNA-binding transcriptional regulator [Actinomyces provencensis]|uniref:LacI family DNA-binding transcriptional regulator n=1 Tax=Actinomyces provencensis TaxID=1720198 RepID=UPI00096A6576|nr:substrate-binding domain-containing protein [Actinomyces provencensis]